MFTLKIENRVNGILTLTQEESAFQVYDIQGLNPPQAQLNFSKIAGIDGSKYNSAKLDARNLVIYIKINGNIENNRIKLYQFFPTKDWCKVYYTNDSRDVYIEGYVETVDVTPFSNNEIMQISIICPQPYFKSVEEIVDDVSQIKNLFEFPFSINLTEPIPFSELNLTAIKDVFNNSESTTGFIIEIEILGVINLIRIVNVITGEYFMITYNFTENDRIYINTNKGEKSIRLIRDGIEINLFPYIDKNSTFFQLNIGDNYFSYIANNGTGNALMHIYFRRSTLYRGV